MTLTPELEKARQKRLAALLSATKISVKTAQKTLGDGNMRSELVISYRGTTFPGIPLTSSQSLYHRN